MSSFLTIESKDGFYDKDTRFFTEEGAKVRFESRFPSAQDPADRAPMIEVTKSSRDNSLTIIFHHCHKHTYDHTSVKKENNPQSRPSVNLESLDKSLAGSECCLAFLNEKKAAKISTYSAQLNSAFTYFISLEKQYLASLEATKVRWLQESLSARLP